MRSLISTVNDLLTPAHVIFWDFDGVIKDSIDVKTEAFAEMFVQFGSTVTNRVRQHHESHGGVPRFEKIPLYMGWAGINATPQSVREYCEKFSKVVVKAVIDSPWVPGIIDYLQDHAGEQYFVLVTATPQIEIEDILSALNISQYFREVHGAPVEKSRVIEEVLLRRKCSSSDALAIGDSVTDLRAAQANSVPFLLRRTPFNCSLQADSEGMMVDDFN